MAVKLSTISNITGFSINTVSRALRGGKGLSAKTCSTIQNVAKELNYVPNYVAGSMRRSKTHTIGVISADSSNPFFAEVILGIEETAKKYGYHILLMNTEEKAENEQDAIRVFQARQVDGLISIPLYDNQKTRELYINFPQPYLFVGRTVLKLEEHSILFDDAQITEKLTQEFLSAGHRDILYLTGPSVVSNSCDRLSGYSIAFKNFGIPVNRDLIFKTQGHIDDGYGVINRVLKQQIKFSAVICFNDLVAMGVLKALHEHGLRVPDDIEVAGCDNLYIAQYMQPRLTTIEVPKYRLGEVAVLELLEHIKDKNRPYNIVNLDSRIIFRESTKHKSV